MSGATDTNRAYTTPNTWVWTSIPISTAPSNATITSVNVEWNVDANCVIDVAWYVDTSYGWSSSTYRLSQTGNDWFPLDDYTQTSADSRTLYPPSNVPVNGTWYFNIRDIYDDANNTFDKGVWTVEDHDQLHLSATKTGSRDLRHLDRSCQRGSRAISCGGVHRGEPGRCSDGNEPVGHHVVERPDDHGI